MLPRLTLEQQDADGFNLELRAVSGTEAAGATFDFELECFSQESVTPDQVLGKTATLVWESPFGVRGLPGWVTRFARKATAQAGVGRSYVLRFEPRLTRLRYVQRSRLFQRKTLPVIIAKVLETAGLDSGDIRFELSQSHVERRYLVQYQETDLNFLNRLCTEAGIYYEFESKIEDDKLSFSLVFRDTSSSVEVEIDPLLITESAGDEDQACVCDLEVVGERRPGRVAVRAYDPERPALALEGTAQAESANDVEKQNEIYAPARWFADSKQGEAEATRLLNRRRRQCRRLEFNSNQPLLRPGVAFECEMSLTGPIVPIDGVFLVSSVQHRWRSGDAHYRFAVAAVEQALPLVAAAQSTKPKIAGLQTATVTGQAGEEIDTDDLGRVTLSFPWDQSGVTDNTSSVPARVLQPNMPGAMLIPRVGWEVLVGFEEGDPDRPLVMGRSYNAAQTPPYTLPDNKDLTVIRTFTSPGGAGMNSQHICDTKGSEHLFLSAAYSAFLNIGNDSNSAIAKKEELNCDTQECSVAANDKTSVKDAYTIQAASQTTTIGGMHSVYTAGSVDSKVGTETVAVGGALLESVGNPISGAANLGANVVISLAGSWAGDKLGGVLSNFGPLKKLGQVAAKKIAGKASGVILGTGQAFVQGATKGWAEYMVGDKKTFQGGWNEGWKAMAKAGVGQTVGLIPGGSYLLKAAEMGAPHFREDTNKTDKKPPTLYPWEDADPPKQVKAAGGGAGAAAGATGDATGPGPGHKIEKVQGGYAEIIGASHSIITPGNISWETTAGQALHVGGCQTVKAKSYSATVGGNGKETSSSLECTIGGDVKREVKGSYTAAVGANLKVVSSGRKSFNASNLFIKAAKMKLRGSRIVFVTPSAHLVLSDKGLIYKGDLTVTGKVKIAKPGSNQ